MPANDNRKRRRKGKGKGQGQGSGQGQGQAQNTAAQGEPSIDERDLAARYGWALSVLRSDPSLRKVFEQAVAETWEPARFIAEVRETKWFQKHSEAVRNYEILKATDPATFKAKQNQTRAVIRDIAVQMGAQVSDETLRAITENVIRFGWNDSQIKDTLAGAIKMGATHTYGGQAAVNAETLAKVALNNGVKIGEKQLRSWLVRIGAGESIAGFEDYVRNMAKTAFPGFEKELDAGMNIRDLADPYINQMADTLELNGEAIDLFDPTIRKALQTPGEDGKPRLKPLWQFEQELRQDDRWMQTNGARKEIMGRAQNVLRDFGLVG